MSNPKSQEQEIRQAPLELKISADPQSQPYWQANIDRVDVLANYAYQCYYASANGKNFNNDSMLLWDELPEAIVKHWRNVAIAMVIVFQMRETLTYEKVPEI